MVDFDTPIAVKVLAAVLVPVVIALMILAIVHGTVGPHEVAELRHAAK